MVNLVRVTDKNLELAYKIQKEIFPEEPEYLFLKGAVESDDKVLNHYIAYVDDKPVGLTGTYTEKCDKDSIWLSWFGILPNCRKKGYGREMLLATIDMCKKLTYKYFRCYTHPVLNASAQPLYKSVFQLCEKYQNPKDVPCDWIYSLSLTNEKVTKWDDKYIGIKEYEQLGKDGEKYRKEHGRQS